LVFFQPNPLGQPKYLQIRFRICRDIRISLNDCFKIYCGRDPDPFDTDPDPARHNDVDLYPAFQFDTDPDQTV
jgi:hypothetical protein